MDSLFMAQIQTNYLKDQVEKIGNMDNLTMDNALIQSLKEILRNQTPEKWDEYYDLYKTAIECCLQINLYHPECMGRRNDKTSLISALVDFATQAKFIIERTKTITTAPSSSCDDVFNNKDNKEMEALCLEVTAIANDTATFLESGGTITLLSSSHDDAAINGSDGNDNDGISGSDDDDNASKIMSSGRNNNNGGQFSSLLLNVIDPINRPKEHVEQYQTIMRNMCFDINSEFNYQIHTYWKKQQVRTSSSSGGGGGGSTASASVSSSSSPSHPTNNNNIIDITRLYKELATYQTQLPIDYASSIFVRVSEQHLDLVRVCIVGPDGTPV